jgi:uncharacterized membrane protein
MKNKVVLAALLVFTIALISASFVGALPVRAAQIDDGMAGNTVNPQADSANGEKIDLSCQYPVLSSFAGTTYTYDVTLRYTGTGSKLFNLKPTVPQGFNSNIIAGYSSQGGGTQIGAILLDGTKTYGDSVKLAVTPYAWAVPPPGQYPISLEASSGDLKASIDLTAVVTMKYDMTMTTPDGRLNVDATAGQDNNFTITLANTGTGDLQNVTISTGSSGRPAGWTFAAKPEKIDTFKAGESKEIQVTIRPTEKTIAGDYELKVMAEPDGKIAFANVTLRVTVITPTIWGWVGVGIVVLVVVALAVIFIRFGRR